MTYGRRLIDDVLQRTETAMSRAHCFLASELALKAQVVAERDYATGISMLQSG